MDFSYSDDLAQISALAGKVFGDRIDDEYHRRQAGVFDTQLWQTLLDTGLLAVGLEESCGGSGLGFLGSCVLLREQGRVLAPVPLLSASVAGMALAEAGDSALVESFSRGDVLLLSSPDSGLVLEGEHVRGTLSGLAFARQADYLVATAAGALVVIDLAQPGVDRLEQQLSNHLPACEIRLDTSCKIIDRPDVVQRLQQRSQVGAAMLQLGVLEEGLRRTALYATERTQFGQPLAGFQAVSQRAADAYIDIEALRASAESAAWRIDSGLEARLEVQVASWWAAEAGHRVAHTTQHLHGGIGADLDYPVHRYFLWAKQLEFSQGGALACEQAMAQLLGAEPALGGRK